MSHSIATQKRNDLEKQLSSKMALLATNFNSLKRIVLSLHFGNYKIEFDSTNEDELMMEIESLTELNNQLHREICDLFESMNHKNELKD